MTSTHLLNEVREAKLSEVMLAKRLPAPVSMRHRGATKPMYSVRDLAERKSWIARYAPLAKRIAHYMMARLPASIEFDDVLQAGMLGLLDAVSRYEVTQGAQFETYAAQRIRGAIVDELRRSDWLPRSVRKSMRKIESAINVLEQRLGRPPTEGEIASQLGLPLGEYQRQLHQARGHTLLHSEDFDDPGGESVFDAGGPRDILDALIDEEFRRRLASGVADLPEREKTVMSLYYEKERNLREIGQVLGVTESRVCQIHSLAAARLRSRLREH
jgi:RNA polymerase sigma factor for flagellar operon FliA